MKFRKNAHILIWVAVKAISFRRYSVVVPFILTCTLYVLVHRHFLIR